MRKGWAVPRFLAAAAVAALLAAPAVRAFAQRRSAPAGAAAISSGAFGGGARRGQRAPQTPHARRIHVSVLPPVDGAASAPCPARRDAPSRKRLARAASFSAPLDHPPA